MRVLGIETSCDETGVAVYDSGRGLLADALYSQVALHQAFGGVVPELASRDHVQRLLPMVRDVLQRAGTAPGEIDGVAYTSGPGLTGALLVGACVGRALAYGWSVPALGVHHMEGHLLAPLLEPGAPAFPLVALLVSGGHTQLVRVDGIGRYRLLGESLDDAAGEAFDKCAKMLGLDYPGGPALAALALQGSPTFAFPRPMLKRPGLDFSFSGLKTAVLHAVEAQRDGDGRVAPQVAADIACSFQEAVAEVLVIKCRRALEAEGLDALLIAGGVSANLRLRELLHSTLQPLGASVHYARPALCTDNGAMIAFAGCQRLLAGHAEGLSVGVRARWPLAELSPVPLVLPAAQ